jgi:class 3 adenylate cyclase
MFCDVVGSTGIASKLGAEDWAHLVNAYLDEMSKAVIGLVGHVLKRFGDGLMALFRYDAAQGTTRNAPRATSMSEATR